MVVVYGSVCVCVCVYVEMMGCAEPIIKKGMELAEAGQYRHAQEILDKLVWAEPDNQEAKNALADVWEQIGYQQENPGLRNSFLAGAFELRSGIPDGASPDSSGPDMIGAMSTELFLDFIGIRMDSKKAEALGNYTMNLITPDNGESLLSNFRTRPSPTSKASCTMIPTFPLRSTALILRA